MQVADAWDIKSTTQLNLFKFTYNQAGGGQWTCDTLKLYMSKTPDLQLVMLVMTFIKKKVMLVMNYCQLLPTQQPTNMIR